MIIIMGQQGMLEIIGLKGAAVTSHYIPSPILVSLDNTLISIIVDNSNKFLMIEKT